MDSGFSALLKNNDESPSSSQNPGLGDLPEGCVALILTHLEPKEICGFARLNRAFRGASSADFVWESKLPTNYNSLIHQVFGRFPENLSKKEIYARLSRPRFLDGGSKSDGIDVAIGTVVTVHNIKSVEIDEDRLFWLFSFYGKVENVRLLKRKPIAQVEMSKNSEAKLAVKHLQGTDFNGQILDLKVENYEGIEGGLKHKDVVKSYHDIDRVHIKRYCKELMLKREAS